MAAEKSFENRVKAHLINNGAWYIKYWAGAKFTKEGTPDVLACVKGYFFGIEIKASDGRPSLIQLLTLRNIRRSGGYGILLYPSDFAEFKRFMIHPDVEDAWYISNIDTQQSWWEKLDK